MRKFGRKFILTTKDKDGNDVIIQSPLTLQFAVKRFAYPALATATFTVLNINEEKRGLLYRDSYQNQTSAMPAISVAAGYGEDMKTLPYIFIGNVKACTCYRREGAVDYITEFECLGSSWAVQKATSQWSTKAGETKDNTILRLIDDMVKADGSLSRGAIRLYGEDGYPRGASFNGNSYDYLKRETEDKCFIDNGVIHVMDDKDEAYEGILTKISSANGLLSTPIKKDNFLHVDMLFEPSISVGQKIALESTSYPYFNSDYKVMGVEHTGIISDSVGGQCKTLLTLWGNNLLTLLQLNKK
jgi:hypothetical protein